MNTAVQVNQDGEPGHLMICGYFLNEDLLFMHRRLQNELGDLTLVNPKSNIYESHESCFRSSTYRPVAGLLHFRGKLFMSLSKTDISGREFGKSMHLPSH